MLFGVEWMQEDLKMVVAVVVLLENGKQIRGVDAFKPLSPVIACLQVINEHNTGTHVCRGDGHA